jgi:outer membrane protease
MEDRDWISTNNATLTHFSSHYNVTRGAFLLDCFPGFSIPLFSKVLLKVYGDLSYMFFSWSAQDGSGRYAETDWKSVPFSGTICNYTQSWVILGGGISLEYSFLKFFSLGGSFQLGRVMACNDQDDHITTKTQYNDAMSGGVLLEPALKFSFSPLERLAVSLHIAYRCISNSRGETTIKSTGSNVISSPYSEGYAGAGYAVLDTGLSVQVRF